jgi:hypothetical protein
MRGTKNFLIAIIFIVVVGGIGFYFLTNRKPTISEEITPQVIFIEPQEFSVSTNIGDSSSIKRAIFIEKIRNVFKSKAGETIPGN